MKRIYILFAFALMILALLCVTSAAFAASDVKLADTIDYSDGHTTISWTGDDGGTGYEVFVEAINNGPSKQTMFYGGKATGNSVTVDNMIPGKSYRVTLTNSSLLPLDQHDYEMPAPTVFEDGKLKDTSIKISLEPRRLKKGDEPKKAKKLSSFTVKEITKGIEDDTYWYGVKYSMKMPQLGHERTFFLTLAFESPDGYLMVVSAEDMTYEYVARGYQTIWYYILGTNYFPNLYKCVGEIPKGQYKTYMFLDGMLVNQNKFKVQ